MIIYILLFLVALGSVHLLTPLSIKIAEKIGAVDIPTERKVHKTPIPRLGGVAVVSAVAISLLVGAAVNIYIPRIVNTNLMGLLVGSLIIIAVGVWDDTRNANPFVKLAFQVIAASIAVYMGVQFELASNPLIGDMRDYFDLGILAFPLSVLWIVGLTNAMNLIDGFDGLACGIALVTSVTLFFDLSQYRGWGSDLLLYCPGWGNPGLFTLQPFPGQGVSRGYGEHVFGFFPGMSVHHRISEELCPFFVDHTHDHFWDPHF